MLITRVSRWSGIERTMDLPVTPVQMFQWENGVRIQDAMPHLTPDQREFIMTGVTPEEWNEMCPPEDENPFQNEDGN
mgnify:CR=1 FL=1